MADLLLRIRADEGNTRGILKGVGESVLDVGKSADKGSSVLGGLGDVLGKVGLAAMGAGAIFGTATSAIQGLIGPATESASVTAQLQAVLKSTGEKAGVTQAAVEDLSKSLSRSTKFDDEAITSAQSLLLTFTNIGQDVFPAATETVLNMSEALGQDLKSSSLQLGKALNDPIQGVTALRRVGVQLSDEQEQLIKSLVAVGDTAGAQNVILGELQTEFGGAAKAAGETFAGQLTILQNEFQNVVETIGGPVIDALSGLLKAVMPAVEAFGDWLPGALEQAQQAMQPVVQFIGEFLMPHLEDLGRLVTDVFAGDFQSAIDLLQTSIIPRIKEFGTTVLEWLEDQLPLLGKQLLAWGDEFLAWVEPLIPPLLRELGRLAGEAFQWISEQAPVFTHRLLAEWIPAFIAWVVPAIPPLLVELGKVLLAIGEWLVTTGVPALVRFGLDMGGAIVGGLADGLRSLAGMVGDAILRGFQSLNFDLGIFHLHGGQFTVTLPTISLPNVTGGQVFGATLAGLQPALQTIVAGAAALPSGGGGGSSDPAVQHSLATNGGDYFATYNFQKGLGSSDADAARIANEAAAAAGKRRYGGPVARGRGYTVGEAGPELFVPSEPGYIVPNGGGGGGGWMDEERIVRRLEAALERASLSVGVDDIHTALLRRQRGMATLGLR